MSSIVEGKVQWLGEILTQTPEPHRNALGVAIELISHLRGALGEARQIAAVWHRRAVKESRSNEVTVTDYIRHKRRIEEWELEDV